jgi:histidinol-phosphate/aromatic aminotransferase/cobyric acid decarboxylase-like protein
MRKVLESYPSQNAQLAGILEPALGVDKDEVFVCNGAVEVIQAAMHRFAGRRVAVVLPTFSPYYEYLRPDQQAIPYRLSREDGFALDVDDFVRFVDREGIDTVCLINPSNPSGSYVPRSEMLRLLAALGHLRLVVVDESFVDFAWEDAQRTPMSLASEVAAMPNAILVKSMSKDFGVAGLRVGYAIMAPDRVRELLGNGYLWNVSGLAEFFFRLFAERRFREDYERARVRYIDEAVRFFAALGEMPLLRTYPTKANFALVELDPSIPVSLVAPLMLIRHGIYVRDCRDKVGLEGGQYLRIAGRKARENDLVLAALGNVLADG